MSHDLINVESVTKVFEGSRGTGVRALDGVSLDVRRGEFVSIVGPSGCGKSTLLNVIAGLEPATAGQVRVDGTPVLKSRRDVSVVFQSPVLLPWRRVIDNVLLPLEIGARRITKAQRARAVDVIDMVGLAGFADSYPNQLSGGMQQRCAIARALMLEAPLLLMDEPFGSLDALTREQLNLEIQDIWMQQNMTVVLITHDIGEAVLLSDRIFVMSSRPGSILKTFDVPSPRPRALEDEIEAAKLSAAIREQLGVGRPNRLRTDREPSDVR